MSYKQVNQAALNSTSAEDWMEELHLDEEQFKELKDSFDLFDIDGSGTID